MGESIKSWILSIKPKSYFLMTEKVQKGSMSENLSVESSKPAFPSISAISFGKSLF